MRTEVTFTQHDIHAEANGRGGWTGLVRHFPEGDECNDLLPHQVSSRPARELTADELEEFIPLLEEKVAARPSVLVLSDEQP